MNHLRISFYQQDIVWGDAEANRRQVESKMNNALGADIFVVPETFTTGFGDHMAALAEVPLGPTFRWAQDMAARHDLLFVGTWIVREGDQCYNRLHWVYPDGRFGYYDKAHTFRVSGEADQISRGIRREVFEWRGWKIKPAICYDLRFPAWLRNEPTLAGPDSPLKYDLLLVCANWPGSRHEAWTTLLKARAIENLCYVLGCNRSGVDGVGGKYTGDSAVIDYKGFQLSEEAEPGTEQVARTTIYKDKLEIFRQRWPLYLDFDAINF